MNISNKNIGGLCRDKFIHEICVMLDPFAQDTSKYIQSIDDPMVGELVLDRGTLASGFYQAALTQHLKVARNSGLGDFQFLGQVGDIARLVRKGIQKQQSGGVGQGRAQVGMEISNFLGES